MEREQYIGESEYEYQRSDQQKAADIRDEFSHIPRRLWKENYSLDDSALEDMQQTLFNSILEDFLRKNIFDLESLRKIRHFIFNLDSEGLDDFDTCLRFHSELQNELFFLIENVDPNIVRKVFNKVSNLSMIIGGIKDFIKDEFSSRITNLDKLESVGMLGCRGAKNVLVKFIDTFMTIQDQGLELSLEEMEQKLERIKTDTILLASTLRSMKKNGEKISLDDIKNITLDGHVPATEIPATEMATMRRLYQENYKQYPELVKVLIDSLEKSFNQVDSDFTILRYKGEIIGFYRIDLSQEQAVHFAAFNVDSQFQGAGLGEAMMLEDLDQLAKKKILTAECDPLARIASNYIERGFVATAYFLDAGEPTLKIMRDDKKVFDTKGKPKEDFLKEYLEFELAGGKGNCDKGDHLIVKGETQEEIDMRPLENGYVLTRYFKYKDDKWYAVFEKKI